MLLYKLEVNWNTGIYGYPHWQTVTPLSEWKQASTPTSSLALETPMLSLWKRMAPKGPSNNWRVWILSWKPFAFWNDPQNPNDGISTEVTTPEIFHCTESRIFCISWINGYIRVGMRHKQGVAELAAFKEPVPLTVSAIVISIDETSGYWEYESDRGTFYVPCQSSLFFF